MAGQSTYNSSDHEEVLQQYLQGELDLNEMEAFERAAIENPDQSEIVLAYSKLLEEVSSGLADVTPSLGDEMRSRILTIADEKPISQVVRASGGLWVESGVPGVQFKMLFQDPETKKMTVLGRIAAGG